jgi:hypothetical protein
LALISSVIALFPDVRSSEVRLIDDRDVWPKRTFYFLMLMFSFTERSDSAQAMPALTVPTNRWGNTKMESWLCTIRKYDCDGPFASRVIDQHEVHEAHEGF